MSNSDPRPVELDVYDDSDNPDTVFAEYFLIVGTVHYFKIPAESAKYFKLDSLVYFDGEVWNVECRPTYKHRTMGGAWFIGLSTIGRGTYREVPADGPA